MDTSEKFKITYYDPGRWCDDGYYETTLNTKEEARLRKEELLKLYPPQYHSCWIKIEKVALIDYQKILK